MPHIKTQHSLLRLASLNCLRDSLSLLSSGCCVDALKVSGCPPAEGHWGRFPLGSSEYVVCKCRATMKANFHMNLVLVSQE